MSIYRENAGNHLTSLDARPDFGNSSTHRTFENQASRTVLEEFARTWKCHNPLRNDRFEFYDVEAVVEDVGFSHGGDKLYRLKGLAAVWHEQCMREVS